MLSKQSIAKHSQRKNERKTRWTFQRWAFYFQPDFYNRAWCTWKRAQKRNFWWNSTKAALELDVAVHLQTEHPIRWSFQPFYFLRFPFYREVATNLNWIKSRRINNTGLFTMKATKWLTQKYRLQKIMTSINGNAKISLIIRLIINWSLTVELLTCCMHVIHNVLMSFQWTSPWPRTIRLRLSITYSSKAIKGGSLVIDS